MEVRSASPDELGNHLARIIAEFTDRHGVPPFGEILLTIMGEPGHEGLGIVAESDGELVAYAFAAPGPDRRVWTLELAADPEIYGCFLEQALDGLQATGVPEAVLWVHSPLTEPPAALAIPERSLYRMSADLSPTYPEVTPEGVTIRGLDTQGEGPALIELNNRAFGDHPEQGGWTERDLQTRLALRWFDPEGVRTAWIGDRMVAFNWTKIHPEPGPDGEVVGEIYSIAVDPSFQGRRLGRTIASDGLRYLALRRGARRAILYVDSSNVAAIQLYISLGFTTEHVDRAYRWRADR